MARLLIVLFAILTTALSFGGPRVQVARVMQLQPNEPDPYPEGVYCTHDGDIDHGVLTGEHKCGCTRVDRDPLCEGTPIENSICRQFCTHRSCKCPITCTVEPPNGDQP